MSAIHAWWDRHFTDGYMLNAKGALIVLPLTVAGLLAVILAVILGSMFVIEKRICANTADKLQVNHNFDFWGGCYVELPDGRYIHIDAYRATEEVTP